MKLRFGGAGVRRRGLEWLGGVVARVECETMGSGRLGEASRWLGYGFKVGKRRGVCLEFLGVSGVEPGWRDWLRIVLAQGGSSEWLGW